MVKKNFLGSTTILYYYYDKFELIKLVDCFIYLSFLSVRPPHLSEHSLEYRDIPVIQGERELINCTVRAISDHEFKTKVYYEPFNASHTEEREELEYKYLKKIINAYIDDSAAIDEQDMLCEI